ncbi:hypothetical protein [Arenimonas sp. MALMAid1274]|uniref:hypothetical protein n=1 Tax=Arenimonas sp. MALMAid1274 TaxID=3411630 RepID=UPI003BA29D19
MKVRLLNELRRTKRISPFTVIANELPLGDTGVRADLVLQGRNFVGVEIKSNRDRLTRLSRQLPVYRSYFDKTMLVIGADHLTDVVVSELRDIEVWIASGLTLRRLITPSLTNDESVESGAAMRAEATQKNLEAFRRRFKATSDRFWDAVANEPISLEHLTLLSRFSEKRNAHKANAEEAAKKKEAWIESLIQSTQSSSVSKKDSSSLK